MNSRFSQRRAFCAPGAPECAPVRFRANLDLFITGSNGDVYTSWWTKDSDWSGIGNNWRDIGGVFQIGRAVSREGVRLATVALFITRSDRAGYTRWRTEHRAG